MEINPYLDSNLLQSYIDTFYGYGNYDADYWFVGMEEGGGGTFDDIQKRLAAWSSRGHRELEDLAEYHRAIGVPQLFEAGTKFQLQPTWNKLIRILMSIESIEPNLDAIKAYQRDLLGRAAGNTCLPELLPLPSRSIKKQDWMYGKHSQIDYLENRSKYGKKLAEPRAIHIRDRISEYCPKVVIFYSLHKWYMDWWKKIANVEYSEQFIEGFKLCLGSNGKTTFAITSHPASKGITSEYFQKVGQIIMKRV